LLARAEEIPVRRSGQHGYVPQRDGRAGDHQLRGEVIRRPGISTWWTVAAVTGADGSCCTGGRDEAGQSKQDDPSKHCILPGFDPWSCWLIQ
jgi:hypothetical protein